MPVLYLQGKSLRKSIPKLPEAKGPEGQAGKQANLKKIILVGESTIAGVGVPTHQEGFAGELASALSKLTDNKISWKVYAKSGYTAKKVTAKILPKINEVNIDLIIVGLGGNDTFTLNKNWSKDIHLFVDNIQSKFPTCPKLFINLPPVDEFPALPGILKFCLDNHTDKLRKQLKEIVEESNNLYFLSDKLSVKAWTEKYNLENKSELYFSDGVHPSKLTYKLWAMSVAESITELNLLQKPK